MLTQLLNVLVSDTHALFILFTLYFFIGPVEIIIKVPQERMKRINENRVFLIL